MLTLPPLPRTLPRISDPDFVRLRSLHPGLRVSPDAGPCLTCKGKGSFRTRIKGEVLQFECNCLDQWRLQVVLLYCGIEKFYAGLTWHDIDTIPNSVQDQVVHDYASHSEGYIANGRGLVLYGPNGTGKTLLVTLVLKMLIERGHDCFFTPFTEMLNSHSRGWRDADEERWFVRRIRNVQVLGVDDIGKEYKGALQFDQGGSQVLDNTSRAGQMATSTFDLVIRSRVAAARPTLFTTNYSMKQMEDGYGGSVMSLLAAASRDIEVTGIDYRKSGTYKEGLDRDSREGLVRPFSLGALL